jgi:hypothetical protein
MHNYVIHLITTVVGAAHPVVNDGGCPRLTVVDRITGL